MVSNKLGHFFGPSFGLVSCCEDHFGGKEQVGLLFWPIHAVRLSWVERESTRVMLFEAEHCFGSILGYMLFCVPILIDMRPKVPLPETNRPNLTLGRFGDSLAAAIVRQGNET